MFSRVLGGAAAAVSRAARHVPTAAGAVALASAATLAFAPAHVAGCTPPPAVTASSAAGSDVFSWGYGQFGALGQGDDKDRTLPSEVQPLDTKDVALVVSHGCSDSSAAVTRDGHLYTWGHGRDGRLGHGFSEQGAPENVPRLVASLKQPVVDVSLGECHGACLTADGSVYSWGKYKGVNRYLLGHGDKSGFPHKVEALEGQRVVQISCGRHHTAARTADGRVFTWGYNKEGLLGHNNRESTGRPTLVKALRDKRVVDVTCGKTHTLFLTSDGHVYVCGYDIYGQIGQGQSSTRCLRGPTLIQGLEGKLVTRVVAGENYSLALTSDGAVYTWGLGLDGQLGHGDTANVSIPKRIESLEGTRVVDARCGSGHTIVQTSAGKLLAFGRGRNGQLGRADELESVAAYRSSPQEIHFFDGKQVESFACGANHSLAVADKQ